MHVLSSNEENIPDWVKDIDSESAFWNIVDHHIKTLLLHYSGKIDTYTLLNEYYGNPFTRDPKEEFWHRKANSLGISDVEFVTHIFTVAHQTDPKARLVFNDYGMEIPGTTTYSPEKDQKNFQLLKSVLEKGAPITAVGFQMHLYARDFLGNNFQKNMESFRNQIRKYQGLGVEVDITELDIRLNEGLSDLSPEERLMLQMRIYEGIIRIAKEEGITHINVWGVSDRDSWLERPEVVRINPSEANPLLFNDGDDPKPALFGVLRGLVH